MKNYLHDRILNEITYDKFLSINNPFLSNNPIIDLRDLNFISTSVMVNLIAGCLWINERTGKPTILIDGSNSISVLGRMGFFQILNGLANVYPARNGLDIIRNIRLSGTNPVLIEATRIDNMADIPGLLSQINKVLIDKLNYLPKDSVNITSSISEMISNIIDHNNNYYGFLAMQAIQSIGKLEVSVADCGIGIQNSLQKNPIYNNSVTTDLHAIQAATTERVTSIENDKTRGNGLYQIYRNSKQYGATLQIRSGNAAIRYRFDRVIKNNGEAYFDGLAWMPGTQICLYIPKN